ncbi:MAG TPA: hypothetical protein VMV73_06510, partial [Candidatus Dormibacteraeota bacterium]|nr:hypothetical protein [Candidatus Dormibacteraeota bacterium]
MLVTSPSLQSPSTGKIVTTGIVAGIIVDLFLILSHAAPFPGIYQFIASGLVGTAAFTSSGYIYLGLLLHLAISVIWAYIYVWIFQRYL